MTARQWQRTGSPPLLIAPPLSADSETLAGRARCARGKQEPDESRSVLLELLRCGILDLSAPARLQQQGTPADQTWGPLIRASLLVRVLPAARRQCRG